MKHTPEPWTTDNRIPTHPFYITGQRELSNNDYLRAMQCVNACAGMEDPESEIQSLRDRVKELEEQLNNIRC